MRDFAVAGWRRCHNGFKRFVKTNKILEAAIKADFLDTSLRVAKHLASLANAKLVYKLD